MSVYVGTDRGVLRVGARRCSRYVSRAACVGAADPYCGWRDTVDACAPAGLHDHEPHFAQASDRCPMMDMPG